MTTTTTQPLYYRVHWTDCPEFSANNAWSAQWGAQRSEDGSQTQCTVCDGNGQDCGEPCTYCDEGWIDAEPGYSACHSADELAAYFDSRRGEPADHEQVIVLTGRHAGQGFDGEPLVIPDAIVATLTWAQLRGRA